MPTEPDDEVVYFNVPLDLATVAWVCEVAEGCHASPAAVIASLLRDVRVDDQNAHLSDPETPTVN